MARADQGGGWGARIAALARRWRGAAPAGAAPPLWPEPRVAGSPARGRRLLAGTIRVGPEVLDVAGRSVWDVARGRPGETALHAMGWLDDLAALGDARARARAQDWVGLWVERHGEGAGPGWAAPVAAWRLLRLLGHARFLLHPHGEGEAALAGVVAAHAAHLDRAWEKAAPGAERMLALVALLQARLAVAGGRAAAERLRPALAREAAATVDAGGAVASRSPEDLLGAMALLAAAEAAMRGAEMPPEPALGAAIARAAPVLRALRHADGGLARFHGGDRGGEGEVDLVLAAAGRPSLAGARSALAPQMGFLRLAAGRSTVIVDAGPPPVGAASARGHASTLAFELTSGRRPLVVSCGPGEGFGPRWARAARATASHSTLSLDDLSSARLAPPGPGEEAERLADGPRRVIAEAAPPGPEGLRADLAHDGWRGLLGLTHARTLRLSADGRSLEGEDVLTTLTSADAPLLDRALEASGGLGLPFALRFHLHPEVGARAEAGGVTLGLRSGEVWEFRHDGAGALALEPSVWLETGRLRPLDAVQVVLRGRVLGATSRLRWTLAKAAGTPEGLRDLGPGPGEDD